MLPCSEDAVCPLGERCATGVLPDRDVCASAFVVERDDGLLAVEGEEVEESPSPTPDCEEEEGCSSPTPDCFDCFTPVPVPGEDDLVPTPVY